MNIWEYQVKAASTGVYPSGLSYPVRKLVGETCEARRKLKELNFDKRLAKLEVGDGVWYVNAIVAIEFNEFLYNYVQKAKKIKIASDDLLADWVDVTGRISEESGKADRDNDLIERKPRIKKLLVKYLAYTFKVCKEYDLDFDDILFYNIEKLFKRKVENKIHGDGDER